MAKKKKVPSHAKGSSSIIVTVADEALGKIHELAGELSAMGMKVDRVLPITGVISGSGDTSEFSAFRGVDGVESVEPEISAGLPPPESSIQ